MEATEPVFPCASKLSAHIPRARARMEHRKDAAVDLLLDRIDADMAGAWILDSHGSDAVCGSEWTDMFNNKVCRITSLEVPRNTANNAKIINAVYDKYTSMGYTVFVHCCPSRFNSTQTTVYVALAIE